MPHRNSDTWTGMAHKKKDLPIEPIVQKPLGLNAQVRLLGMTFTLLAYSPFADDPMRLICKNQVHGYGRPKVWKPLRPILKFTAPTLPLSTFALQMGAT